MSAVNGTGAFLLGYGTVVAVALAVVVQRRGEYRALLLAPLWALVGSAAAAALAGAVLWVLERAGGSAPSLVVVLPVSAASLLIAGAAIGRWLSPKTPSEGLRRGAVVAAPAPLSRAGGNDDARIRFAGVALAPPDETKHFKLIGTTGTGKSTAIRALLAQAIARGDRAIFADPDGGYLARFYDPTRGDVILNPFDPRGLKWDPFQELRTPYDCDQLARSLIGEGTGPDRAWRGYAQLLFSALLRRLQDLGPRSIDELCRLLTAAPVDELRLLLDGTPAQPFLEAGNERMFGSIRAVATASTTALAHIRAQSAAAFSVRNWVQQGSGLLFMPYRADQVAALHTIISTWLRTAIFQTMSQAEGDHRLWFVIDELDALGAIDGLKDALARLRKFGGRCVLGFQAIAQLTSLYGASDSQTIAENCGTTLILRCSASEQGGTAGFAARLIGEREVVRDQLTRNLGGRTIGAARAAGSASSHVVLEPAVLASEIEQLPDLCGFLKVASRPDWLAVRIAP